MNRIVLRNTIISVLLIAALFAVVLLRDGSPYGRNQSSFAAEPGQEITRIEIDEEGKKVSLEKKEGAWLVDGKNESRKNAVINVLYIITEMRIKSPVSAEVFREEITGRNIKTVRVSVFGNRKVLKRFIVYKTNANPYGNIMKLSSRSRPFIVYVPGYSEEIGSAFNASPAWWQPFTIFNLLPSEIESVAVENRADPSSSFTINSAEGSYFLSGAEGWDSARVKRYISYFTYIPFENRTEDLTDEMRTKIISGETLFRITVMKTPGERIVLDLREKPDSISGGTDSDRLYGSLNAGGELFIIRYFDIDPLLKKRSWFYNIFP